MACYKHLQKYLRHCTVFWHKWPVHDLVLVIPPPPLIKVASNTRPCSKLGGTTLNWREEGGEHYVSQTCDLERFDARKVVFSWECHSIFATGWSSTGQSSVRYRWGQGSTDGKPDVFWSWIVTSNLCFFSGASELFPASEGLFSLVFGGREPEKRGLC